MTSETKPYGYYDTPDGEDVFQKLLVVLKPTALTGLAVSTADVMLYSKPKGYMATLGRYAYITIPIMGISTAFVITSNMLCSIRKKDDALNWAAGGMAAGAIFGTWRRCVPTAWISGGALAMLGYGKKTAVINGYDIFPKTLAPAHGGAVAVRHDWTLTKDNPGQWKRI